ncbi:MAG: tetratricopeptide repeat protein [Kiritimatiellae bacterium]|nr:tetratricopeptide repeat protein [Kiritimatiellia bacterium]
MKRLAAIVTAISAAVLSADDMEVAKNALRDGLYDVARKHAAKVDGPEAALVVFESHVREGKWEEALKALDAHPGEKGEPFVYGRALALEGAGRLDEASAMLASADFSDPVYAGLAIALKADIARTRGDDPAEILKLAAEPGFPSSDIGFAMNVAWAKEKTGDLAGAKEIWRTVVDSTNAAETVLAAAATSLGEAEALRKACARMEDPELKRATGLRLGQALLSDPATFAEGEKTIRFLAKESPDADGAKEAFLALADAHLKAGDCAKAADTYQVALEVWPDAAHEFAVQEGRAWALKGQGKTDEALDAFTRAFDTAGGDEDRARMLLAKADILSAGGRSAEAMEMYRSVLERYPATPSGAKSRTFVELSDLESKGLDLYRDFRFGEAEKVFSDLAARDPARAPRMEYLQVLCLYGQGRDDEAQTRAGEIAKTGSDPSIRAAMALWLAKFSYNARKWGRARELFTLYATELAPDSPEAPAAFTWAARAAFSDQDYKQSVALVTSLAKTHPDAGGKATALLIQGEALVKLCRFDEAIVVFDKVGLAKDVTAAERRRAKILKSDVLLVMGGDNAARYAEALDGYRAILQGERLTQDEKLSLSFKIANTLDKMGRTDDAIDQYYSEVVCTYRAERMKGAVYDEESKALFARAAFRLSEIYELRGHVGSADRILELVETSDVKASVGEAVRRRKRLKKKGSFR